MSAKAILRNQIPKIFHRKRRGICQKLFYSSFLLYLYLRTIKNSCVKIQSCSWWVFVTAGSDTKLKDAVPKSPSSYSDYIEILQEFQQHRIEMRRCRNQHFAYKTYNKARHHRSLWREVYGINRCHCVLVLAGVELIFYGAVFWIFIENGVDKIGMFSLLLSSAYTVSRAFLFQ